MFYDTNTAYIGGLPPQLLAQKNELWQARWHQFVQHVKKLSNDDVPHNYVYTYSEGVITIHHGKLASVDNNFIQLRGVVDTFRLTM